MINTLRQYPYQLIYIALLSVVYVSSLNNAFFWDTVQLGSKHANFYFSTNFSSLWLPERFDSGHIPTFGIYLAYCWKIFGRTLIVSHLAMMPFIIGIVWQLMLLLKRFFQVEYRGIALLLVGLDSTLLGQITLVSPDVTLVFFFLVGLNCVMANRRLMLAIAILGLFLTSMRGMMTSVCLLIIDVLININFKRDVIQTGRSLLKRSLIYWPAFLLFLTYSIGHYYNSEWIAYHPNSPWAESFELVGIRGVLYNIGILFWRLIDFGRIIIWLIIVFLSIRYWDRVKSEKTLSKVLLIAICFLIIIPINMLWAKGLMGHRYLLPIFLLIALYGAKLLFTAPLGTKFRNAIAMVWVIVLLTGNLWVYPTTISQGWDSSLAHLPYYNLRLEALSYLDENKIPLDQVESFFPNLATLDEIDLSKDLRSFKPYEGSAEYVFYSNIYNIDDDAYESLNSDYTIAMEVKKFGVFIRILHNNNFN